MTATNIATSTPWGKTHGWLRFSFNTEKVHATTWAVLGECSSKIEHVSGVPLRTDTADAFRLAYVAKGIHATTAIEGNTLTEEQVRERLAGDLPLPPTQDYLGVEVDNMSKAFQIITARIEKDVPSHEIDAADLCLFNRTILEGTHYADWVVPGRFRERGVGVGDYLAPDAVHVDELVREMYAFLNHPSFSEEVGSRFVNAILRAILAHLYIAWIHPFGDGNGRTARIVEFDILVRAGVPIECGHLLSDYYNRTRSLYYRALSDARRDPVHFVSYAALGLREMLREQLAKIRVQQTEVAWINYVHDRFRNTDHSEQTRRRREVALTLAFFKEPQAPEAIPKLTPKLAELFARRTARTLQRDLRQLRAMNLVKISPDWRYSANIDAIRAFLPTVRKPSSEASKAVSTLNGLVR